MTQAERLKQTIERQIVTGELREGERLEEKDIAERFGVSRTPVREALMMLEASNLIQRRPRLGAIVKGMNITTLIQSLECLSGMESFAAELAAKRIRKSELAALQKAAEACRQAAARNDADTFYDRNIRFHTVIDEASHNKALLEQIQQVGQRLAPFLRYQHHQAGWLEKSVEEHDRLLEAITKGDGAAASRLTREHAKLDGEMFAEFVSQLNG